MVSTTIINNNRDGIEVIYHSTKVLTVKNGIVTLNSGGYRTATTKRRMNQGAAKFNLDFVVYQDKFDWFVNLRGDIIPFTDGMQFKA